jgi:mono/diheme cytochrome c family protein
MARHPISHRRKVLFIVIGAVSLVLIGGGIGFFVLLSGAYSTAATKQHFAITYKILDIGLRYSVRAYADEIVVPPLSDRRKLQLGHACYRQYCVQCHGAPGVARDDVGKGMLPSPSSLSQSAREWPAAHLYYVTKKGVRMAGMPAWEFRMSEGALWGTVAFLKAMPFLEEGEYRRLAQTTAALTCPPALHPARYSEERAKTVLRQYACHNCHQIDHLVGPDTYVGPPLQDWRKRKLIAGVLPNTPENLVRWVVDPQQVSPGTLMPDLGVSEAHAREMAVYLFGREQ